MRTIDEIIKEINDNEKTQKTLEKELNDVLCSVDSLNERSKIPMVGNIGEWSEIYVFYRIMESGKIKPAELTDDGKLQEVQDAFLPVLKIMREDEGFPIEYYTANDLNGIKGLKIYYEKRKEPILSCSLSEFSTKANELLEILKTKGDKKAEKGATPGLTKAGKPTWSSFNIPDQKSFLNNILITKIKSPATKINEVFGGITDITMEILQNDNMRVPVGFSIKSDLGHNSALFNYSKGSNVIYELENCTEENYNQIKSINKNTTSSYAVERIRYILNQTDINVRFDHFEGKTFENNLRLIADRENEVIAYSLLYSLDFPIEGQGSNRRITNVLKSLISRDPLKIGESSEVYYKKRLKDFLFAKAGGMSITQPWNGDSLITGGYIYVTKGGDVLAFYASDQNTYKEWLLNSTKFDTPSSSDDRSSNFADVFEDETKPGRYFLKLNILIKFIQ